jgi:hypothetical protein
MATLALFCLPIHGQHRSGRELPAQYDANVLQFIDQFQRGQFHGHRTGLMHRKEFHTIQRSESVKSARHSGGWRREVAEEFAVIHDPSDTELKEILLALESETGLQISPYSETHHTYRLKSLEKNIKQDGQNDPSGRALLSADPLIAMGKQWVESLPALQDKVDYFNDSKSFVNDRLESVTLRFQRLFRGGMVRKNASYLDVTLTPQGDITEIEIRWPRFERTGSPSNTLPFEQILRHVREEYACSPALQDPENRAATRVPRRAHVKGAAFAWFPLSNEHDQEIISPCLSFMGEVTMEDDVAVPRYVDAPLLAKYFNPTKD